MQQSYNANNRWKQPRLFLANPQKTYVKNGVIPYVKDLNLSLKFNNIKEMTFKLYEYEDGVKNEFYDLIEPNRLIELQYIDWFQIDEPPETYLDNDKIPYKTVKCLSLENQLVRKRIDAIDGVYSLYDVANPSYSILHIVHSLCGWNIGHVDAELLSLYRTFQVDTDFIYNFLTTTISQSFDCIFVFDNYSKTISAYKLENIENLTNIIISEKNLLNQATVETYSNQIVTKLLVKGNDTCDIRAVNPNGTNYLINVDYYLTKISEGGWMSDGLVDNWNDYKAAYASAQSTWISLINSLKTKNGELTVLKAELTDLKSAQTAQSDVYSSILQNNNGVVPPVGSPDYTIYIAAWNSYNSYFALIANKQVQITGKEVEIASIQTSLDSLSSSLDPSNYLTTNQIAELETFLIEGDSYQDDTFVITDTMTETEAIQMKLELMDNGTRQLAMYSHPQYTYKISAKNLFSIIDNPENVCKFEDWREDLDVGNLVTIKLRDDYWVTTRIMEIDIDYNNLEEIQIVLSDKTREDTRTTQMAELFATAGRTSAALNLYKYGYSQASGQVSDVRTFLNSSLNATLNSVVNNDNQDLLIDTYGLHMRKWLPDQNKFSDYQSWWLNNVLLFTDDGFQSATTAIGLLTAPDGSNYWGLNTEVLVGSLIMGERMILTNASGNYTWDNNGMVATATVGSNTYLVGINPSTPSTIFRIAVNGSNKLYVDTIGSRLVFSGSLIAGDINIGSGRFVVDSSGLVTINSNGLIVNSSNFSLTSDGTLSASNGNFTGGNITGSNILLSNGIFRTELNSGSSTMSQLFVRSAKIDGTGFYDNGTTFLSITPAGISYLNTDNTYLSMSNTGTITCSTITSTAQNFYLYGQTIRARANYLSLNGSDFITEFNMYNYTYPPQAHTQASTTITAVDTGGGNIAFAGKNAASVTWCNATFQPLSSSDVRLKKNIKTLDELPIELYLELNPVQFEFIDDPYNEGIIFGFIAQDVIEIFKKHGYDALEYNLVQKAPIRTNYPDEAKYIDDWFKYRINYTNMIAWNKLVINKIWDKVKTL